LYDSVPDPNRELVYLEDDWTRYPQKSYEKEKQNETTLPRRLE